MGLTVSAAEAVASVSGCRAANDNCQGYDLATMAPPREVRPALAAAAAGGEGGHGRRRKATGGDGDGARGGSGGHVRQRL